MLLVEIGVFGRTMSRLTVGIVIGYATFCAILLGLAAYFAFHAEWKQASDVFSTFVLLIIYLLALGDFLVRRLGRFLEAVAAGDRGTALKLYAWVYSPFLFAIALWCCAQVLEDAPVSLAIPGLRPALLDGALRWAALLASVTWVLVSAPIARLWATNTAQSPEALLTAEESLFISQRQREFEAKVSIQSYYALILSFLAMLFLIFDSIIGELFERLTGISGYVGAVIASIVVATMLYPIHRKFEAFVAHIREVAQESGRADALHALRSAVDSTRRYLSVEPGLGFIALVIVLFYLGWGLLSFA